jgi:hypothetical protein
MGAHQAMDKPGYDGAGGCLVKDLLSDAAYALVLDI